MFKYGDIYTYNIYIHVYDLLACLRYLKLNMKLNIILIIYRGVLFVRGAQIGLDAAVEQTFKHQFGVLVSP